MRRWSHTTWRFPGHRPVRPRRSRQAPRCMRQPKMFGTCKSSYRDFRVTDFGGIVDAQAEFGSILDVAGLPNEAVHIRILLPIRQRGAVVFHVALPNGDRALLFPLVIDHIDQESVDRHRVGSELHLLGIETVALVSRKWSAVPDAAQAVHDLQYGARQYGLRMRQRADEAIRFRLGLVMRSGD